MICVTATVAAGARRRFRKFKVLEVESELADAGAEPGEGVGVGGGGGGGVRVARAADVGVVGGHRAAPRAGHHHGVAADPRPVRAGGHAGDQPIRDENCGHVSGSPPMAAHLVPALAAHSVAV